MKPISTLFSPPLYTLNLALYTLIALFVGGCFSGYYIPRPQPPKITAFKDPAFSGVSYARLAIVVDTSDLEWRHELETKLAEDLRREGFQSVEGFSVFPPTRPWRESEKVETLALNGVDGYLRLIVDNAVVEETLVPLTTKTTTTRETSVKRKEVENDSTKREVETESVTTETSGGYTVRSARTQYRVSLIDVRSGRVAWLGLNSIEGDPAGRIVSFCREIVGQLERDSLLRRIPPSPGS